MRLRITGTDGITDFYNAHFGDGALHPTSDHYVISGAFDSTAETLTLNRRGLDPVTITGFTSGGGGDIVILTATNQDVEPNGVAYVSRTEQYWNISPLTQSNVVLATDFADTAVWRQIGDGGGGLTIAPLTQGVLVEDIILGDGTNYYSDQHLMLSYLMLRYHQ